HRRRDHGVGGALAAPPPAPRAGAARRRHRRGPPEVTPSARADARRRTRRGPPDGGRGGRRLTGRAGRGALTAQSAPAPARSFTVIEYRARTTTRILLRICRHRRRLGTKVRTGGRDGDTRRLGNEWSDR